MNIADLIEPKKTESVMVRLEPETKERLEEHATKHGVSPSAIVRALIKEHLEEFSKTRKNKTA